MSGNSSLGQNLAGEPGVSFAKSSLKNRKMELTLKKINKEIAEIKKQADDKIRRLNKQKKIVCPHPTLKPMSFFVSTTTHEWDECVECGMCFNEIDYPA